MKRHHETESRPERHQQKPDSVLTRSKFNSVEYNFHKTCRLSGYLALGRSQNKFGKKPGMIFNTPMKSVYVAMQKMGFSKCPFRAGPT